MTDKDVGELLDRTQRTLNQCKQYPWKDWDGSRVAELAEEQIALIRKLGEERAALLRTNHLDDSNTHHLCCEKCQMDYSEWIKLALRDFGIDPSTWPKE